MSSSDSTTIPEELQCFDVQERNGELTAKVGLAEVLDLVDWLVEREGPRGGVRSAPPAWSTHNVLEETK
jgi:hypothetical protein